MQVCSTRDAGVRLSFNDSLLAGLPPGGGLYQPYPPPDLTEVIAGLPDDTPYVDLAAALTEALLGDDLASGAAGRAAGADSDGRHAAACEADAGKSAAAGVTGAEDAGGAAGPVGAGTGAGGQAAAREVAAASYPFAPALSWLGDEMALLELYHGPTCAFKDFGAAFLATVLERRLAAETGGAPVVVLVATSGDTGGAVARAFWRRAGIEVVLLYPSGRISRLQEQQLTALGDNIHAVEIGGSFDDCQRLVKQALVDRELVSSARLCPANSISLGRLLPQAYYYIFAGLRLRAAGPPLICVPSGNFGNLTAAVYAAQWGLPVAGFWAATNSNDVVPGYLESGALLPRASVATLSNAMDVGNPSNFERILARWNHDHAAVSNHLKGCAIGEEETVATMRQVHERYGRLIEPHTAVGIAAARRLRARRATVGSIRAPIVVAATADPGKFPETVQRATGVSPPIPAPLQALLDRPKQATPLAPGFPALRAFILARTAAGSR
ncbi:MAG: threonine synthase [Spirochaetaceae bacterium]|nr:threonine synthase [Spirochaetaceae bacterium]